jgi:hypothetical protein
MLGVGEPDVRPQPKDVMALGVAFLGQVQHRLAGGSVRSAGPGELHPDPADAGADASARYASHSPFRGRSSDAQGPGLARQFGAENLSFVVTHTSEP